MRRQPVEAGTLRAREGVAAGRESPSVDFYLAGWQYPLQMGSIVNIAAAEIQML